MNTTLRLLRIVACLSPVFACSVTLAERTHNSPTETETTKLDSKKGMAIYESTCAECHETGAKGAPRLHDPDAWSKRSFTWFSVLKQHASSGFLGMPAKGKNPDLSEEDISNAVFYMLEELNKTK